MIPELRPYRTRADVGTWFRDESVIPYLEDRLRKYKYAGIGEFHLYGADADLPVPRKMVELARKHNFSCTRIPTSTRSSACSGNGRRRASCGRTPDSTGPSGSPRC